MKIAVFGAGYLGRRIARDLGADLLYTDILDPAIESFLRNGRYDAVINAAGRTGRPNVDWCEVNQEATYRANVEAPLALYHACRRAGVYLLHLGSGCIFYGRSMHSDGAWREGDVANPVSYYSRTKYAADLVLGGLPGVAIARLRMPLDGAPDGRNLITKLAGYRQVVDVENSVTVIEDLVHVVRRLLLLRAEGIFHAVNPGAISHREILALYQECVDENYTAEFVDESELERLGLVAKRRSSAVLASDRLADLGIAVRPVSLAVRSAMEEYALKISQLTSARSLSST